MNLAEEAAVPNSEAPWRCFLSAVLVHSTEPRRLAAFYQQLLGLPLKEEFHDGTPLHYGCELGDVHFAIHPAEGALPGRGPVHLAFAVADMAAFVARARRAGAPLLYAPCDRGFAIMTALRDLDGNVIEITQLSGRWLEHLRANRGRGNDILQWLPSPGTGQPPFAAAAEQA